MENTQAAYFDVSDFEAEVLRKSHATPVVVDFWAPWCGPCRVLGPVLERLAAEAGGAWTLAKVNTDELPEPSMRYGIRGIPAVKLFMEGEVMAEFTGALPEPDVRRWLDAVLPNPTKERLALARQALEDGDRSEAQTLLEDVLREQPDHAEAHVLLAQTLAFDDPERALALTEEAGFVGPALAQTKEAVQTLARLMELGGRPDALSDEPGRDAYLAAVGALKRHDFDAALERLIEVIRTDRYYDDDGARKAAIALFTLLGPQHEATRQHRRTFDMALY